MKLQKERRCGTKGCKETFVRTPTTRMRKFCSVCQKERSRNHGNRTDIQFPCGEYSLAGLGER
jgi:hypothetical protein